MATPTPAPSTASKAEAFVLDVIGLLTKLDPSSLSSDYQYVMIGIQDIQKIVAALQELDQLKNNISNTNT
ncbi:MAG: hypothetical protein ACHQVS_00680 [Candidatus Babeliales bacterium]